MIRFISFCTVVLLVLTVQVSYASGWDTAERIDTTNPERAGKPQVAVDPDGNAVAVWDQEVWDPNESSFRYDIYSARYLGGIGWTTPELIETDDTGNALDSQVGVDADGNAIAVWEQFDGTRFNT